MSKVIRLTENDLLNIVKMVLEQADGTSTVGYHTLVATTDPTPIVNAEVLQRTGLPCDETNFKKMWMSYQLNDYQESENGKVVGTKGGTWSKKDLSQFRVVEQTPPTEDYFAVRVYKKVKRPDNRGFMYDPNRESKMFELKKGEGTKTFNTFYMEPNDPNTIWQIGNIMAAGNGLLALARGLNTYTSAGKVPNQITIGFEQSQRVSSSIGIDMDKINDVRSFYNGYARQFIAVALKKNGITSTHPQWDNSKTYQDVINDVSSITMMGLDRLFIPEQDLESVRPKLRTQLNTSKLTGILNSIPMFKSPDAVEVKRLQRYNQSTSRIARAAGQSLGDEINNLLSQYINHIREVYINRFKEYVQLSLPQDQQSRLLSTINPTQYDRQYATLGIQTLLDVRAAPGRGYTGANKQTSSGTYERGASG